MKNSDRIPADKSQAFTRWEMPEVNEGQIIQAEKTRRDVARGNAPEIDKSLVVYGKLTVGEIENISKRIQEDVQKKAFKIGVKKGHDKGYQAGLEQGQQDIQQQLQSLQTLISYLTDALQSQDAKTEQGLVNIAVGVAESVLRRELSIESSHVNSVIQEAIASIGAESQTLDIYLNPQDFKLLQEQGEINPNWSLHQDAEITAGGCRLSNQLSLAEYTTEAQFEQTISQLVDSRYADLLREPVSSTEPNDILDDQNPLAE
ncbi:MAG: flagellar assembly protein FliH [Pseudohongiellaceae bacterium]|jgi:flagellar assembly protein FliH